MGNPKLVSYVPPVVIAPLLPSAAEQRRERLVSGHIVIVCGGRNYLDRERVFAAMDLAHAKRPITLLVHGACIDRRTFELQGADRWADEWARERSVRIEQHPANWGAWGKAAGPMRNKQMAEAGAQYPSGELTLNPGSLPRMLVSTNKCVDTWTLLRSDPKASLLQPDAVGGGTLRNSKHELSSWRGSPARRWPQWHWPTA